MTLVHMPEIVFWMELSGNPPEAHIEIASLIRFYSSLTGAA